MSGFYYAIKEVDTIKINEIMSNLLVLLVAILGAIRGIEWVARSNETLVKASKIYVTISQIIDIQSLGWLMLISAAVLASTIFISGRVKYVSLVIGGFATGSIFLFYGMASTEFANLIATYYTFVSLGLYGYILGILGVIALWKTRQKK